MAKILGTLVVGAMMIFAIIQIVGEIYQFEPNGKALWSIGAKGLLILSGVLFMRAIWSADKSLEKDDLEDIHQ